MAGPTGLNKKAVWALGVGAFLAALVVASWALYDSLIPLFLAFGLAYALSPVVDFLEKKHVPRAWGTALLLSALGLTGFLLAATFIPVIVRDGREFVQNVPDYFSTAVEKVAAVGERYGFEVPVRRELVERIQEHLREASLAAFSPAVGLVKRVFSGVGSAVAFVLNFLIVPVFFFYFLRDLPYTKRHAYELIPPRHRGLALAKWEKVDRVFSGYIRGQMTVSLILAVFFAAGLSILRVKFGLVIGLLAGLLNIIPYLGQITGLALSLIMALVDFTGWGRLAAVPVLFAVGNFVEGNFITPKIVGDKVGLSPMQTILALIPGGR
jgi:predicted PurR-regulated permease PerM